MMHVANSHRSFCCSLFTAPSFSAKIKHYFRVPLLFCGPSQTNQQSSNRFQHIFCYPDHDDNDDHRDRGPDGCCWWGQWYTALEVEKLINWNWYIHMHGQYYSYIYYAQKNQRKISILLHNIYGKNWILVCVRVRVWYVYDTETESVCVCVLCALVCGKEKAIQPHKKKQKNRSDFTVCFSQYFIFLWAEKQSSKGKRKKEVFLNAKGNKERPKKKKKQSCERTIDWRSAPLGLFHAGWSLWLHLYVCASMWNSQPLKSIVFPFGNEYL